MTDAQAAEYSASILSREHLLSLVAKGEATMSTIVGGTREALNDINEMLGYSIEEGDTFASDFFAFYKRRTGREYYSDAGNPKKMARQILRRSKIIDATEYRFIDGILGNAEQTIFKDDELDRINDMLARFAEAGNKG